MNELLVVTPNGYKTSKLYSVVPANGTGDLTWVRNTTATRVNSSGLIESVGANVPRLDYSGGVTCPCILVEPQRTNLALRSEEFNNATWQVNGVTATPDSVASPNGLTTAETITVNASGGSRSIFQVLAIATTVYTFSAFVKPNTSSLITIGLFNSGSFGVAYTFNLSTQTATLFSGAGSSQIQSFANGWYKLTITSTNAITSNLILIYPGGTANAIGDSVYIWGAQLEAGATATSYIPTVGSIQTRNADVATVTTPVGITSLIETYEDNTTNVVNPIPVTYQMSEGRIAKVVGL